MSEDTAKPRLSQWGKVMQLVDDYVSLWIGVGVVVGISISLALWLFDANPLGRYQNP